MFFFSLTRNSAVPSIRNYAVFDWRSALSNECKKCQYFLPTNARLSLTYTCAIRTWKRDKVARRLIPARNWTFHVVSVIFDTACPIRHEVLLFILFIIHRYYGTRERKKQNKLTGLYRLVRARLVNSPVIMKIDYRHLRRYNFIRCPFINTGTEFNAFQNLFHSPARWESPPSPTM